MCHVIWLFSIFDSFAIRWFNSFLHFTSFFSLLSLLGFTQWMSELIHSCYIAKWNVCSRTHTHIEWRKRNVDNTEKNYYNLVPLLAFMISLYVSVQWNICHPHNCEYVEWMSVCVCTLYMFKKQSNDTRAKFFSSFFVLV